MTIGPEMNGLAGILIAEVGGAAIGVDRQWSGHARVAKTASQAFEHSRCWDSWPAWSDGFGR